MIDLHINSLGGSITADMAASMGALLLTAGAKGKRYALPNSEVMIHWAGPKAPPAISKFALAVC